MTQIENFISDSGDSVLQDYNYSNGILSLTFIHGEKDIELELNVSTEILSFSNSFLLKESEIYKTFRIELERLEDVLDVKNGMYVPNNSFGGFMKETRENYHLAYGKKSKDFKFLLSLKGYGNLVACLIHGMESLSIQEIS